MKIYVYTENSPLAGQVATDHALPEVHLFAEGSQSQLAKQAWQILDSQPTEYEWRCAKSVLRELGVEVVYDCQLRIHIPVAKQETPK